MSEQSKGESRTAAQTRAELAKLKPYWYSPIDFGNGVVTGTWAKQRRFNRRKRLLQIPADLSGKRVLDIGSWDGYWALEFTRRGAHVECLDLWSDAGVFKQFQFVSAHFGCEWPYYHHDVQALDEVLAGTFDVVFCAGVLYHLRYPLATLERLRRVTRDMLILETVGMIPAVHSSYPMIAFFPGDDAAAASGRNWGTSGAATMAWVREACLAAGFARVEVKYRPSFSWFKKLKALVTNRPGGGRIIVHAYVN